VRLAIVCVVVVLAAALAAIALAPSSTSSRCGDAGPSGDYAFPQETLRDWVSYFEQLSVVRAVGERRAGSLHDSSGVVGRYVSVEVERTPWRRPGGNRAPDRFETNDWGWGREDDGSLRPLTPCGETRMVVGRRYLAIVGRYRGEWFPATTGRLRLDGSRAVGGVDGGRPSEAHEALAGMTVPQAARRVAGTRAYRAAVERADRAPVARWRAVHRDGYR
jgi:hypothetical protein